MGIFVHPKNTTKDLTMAQLKEIFSGRRTAYPNKKPLFRLGKTPMRGTTPSLPEESPPLKAIAETPVHRSFAASVPAIPSKKQTSAKQPAAPYT